jgi:pyruvate ferredoxin oxidoreductase gamma subunit
MIEIRIHGRGGQGAVTAAQLLAIAAFYDGKYAQAFPMFGVERRGAPATSFVRIDDKPINVREQIYNPDYIIVFDPSLIEIANAKKGLKHEMIVNTKEHIKGGFCQDLTCKAIKLFGKPIINTLVLGTFAGRTKIITLESLKKAIDQKFKGKPELAEKNKKAVEESYNESKN